MCSRRNILFQDGATSHVAESKRSPNSLLEKHCARLDFGANVSTRFELQLMDNVLLCAVGADIWRQVIGLYPALVECTTSTSPQVCKALKGALSEYKELLSAPEGHR